ncbi:Por secretion system C-terminal sorting domain-containing protein [Dyadobacter soli]|uniref:Por secretion system C-terminal sorting domain-containing protein n=2 Tax=Dyadobacter soli TaxID=659014 RepID=A0A1G8C0S3_9BACT|nr:Por secretion system C-terminal sorting domain-containing protein [Dyadobacter soli]
MLFAAMALAAGAAGYFTSNSEYSFRGSQISAQQNPSAGQEQVAGLSAKTVESIKEMIAKQEYHISYDDVTKSLQSPNRKQNLRAYYKPGNLTVKNRVDSTGHNFKLELINEGIFADGKQIFSPQSSATPTNNENKLLIDHKGFTEEFINTEDGVRQNFIVSKAPENTRNLQVKLSAKGLKAQNGSENEIRFYRENAKGDFENFVVYSDLHCWDANKKPLAATLAYVDNHVEINVAVEGAAYPVTIDPIVANGTPNNVNKTLESEQFYAGLGYSLASAGDVNKDGYSDVIVGAPKYDWNGEDAGVAFVFPGSPTGITLNAQRLNRNQPFAQMGYSVSSAGDVNKDGYSDVIVGAPFWEDSPAQNSEGAAFLYFGGPVDPQNAPIGIVWGNFVTLQSDQAEAQFGISVALAGDVNSDGYSDFMVGAHLYDKDQTNEGVAFLYYGVANGGYDSNKTEILESNQADAMFGYALAGAGDINADGASDIIVGARLYDINANKTNEGAAFVFKGTLNSAPISAAQPQTILGTQPDSRFGHTVSTAGDVNGDGFADIAIGSYNFDGGLSNEGAVYIHHGGQTGINTVANKTIEGNQLEANYGWAVASAGDVNGDGYGDLIVGARYFSNGQNHEGAAFVYHGSNIGLNTTAASFIESNQGDAWLGWAVSSAGDVNGDGYSDILIGSYAYDHGHTDEGVVFVYHGGAGTVGATPKTASYAITSGALDGSSVSIIGDYNGDGLDDVVSGAPNFDGGTVGEGAVFLSLGDASLGVIGMVKYEGNQLNAKFGCSVSGVGDTDGDGFDDFVVGATGAVFSNSTGIAYLFTGSSQGTIPAGHPLYQSSGNLFGTSVAGGDINRDGYGDIIISAPLAKNGFKSETGLIGIYPGSANGVNNTTYTNVYGPNIGTKLGSSLATADVNGDGFADIVAGASGSSNGQGSIHIWHGSLNGVPNNTLSNLQLTSNTPNASFGAAVSGAGDVNGDGFGDIIVGAPGITSGENNEGVAKVFYGSVNGCSSFSVTTLQVNQAEAAFGTSVAGAGDVNGDGYSDVIVGAPLYDNALANGGGIWIFHGAPNGVNITSSFSLTGQQVEEHFGQAVSGGGDLNGDGYSDVVVGSPGLDESGVTNGGTVRAYFGNDGIAGKNKRNNIRLYNSNLTRMTYSQTTQTSVYVGIYPASFLGRNNGRLAWDYAQNGTSFSKGANNPITNSTIIDGWQPAFSTLQSVEITGGINKPWEATRLRVRFKYELATALTGQVYGPWRAVPEYLLYLQPLDGPPVLASEKVETANILNTEPEYTEIVTVYPNPVSDRLFIQSTNLDQIKSLQLISANGTMAFTSAKPQTELDVKHLPAGSYILMINKKDGSKTSHKVLIQK